MIESSYCDKSRIFTICVFLTKKNKFKAIENI